jgi:preprotein translocase SecE subunit
LAIKSVVQFVSEVRLELSRVIWPKFDEWVGSTVIVVFLMIVFAIYLFFVDKGLDVVMRYVLGLYS